MTHIRRAWQTAEVGGRGEYSRSSVAIIAAVSWGFAQWNAWDALGAGAVTYGVFFIADLLRGLSRKRALRRAVRIGETEPF